MARRIAAWKMRLGERARLAWHAYPCAGRVRLLILAVFLRRLKPGCSYSDFEEAWRAEKGFGVPARVISASSLADPRDVLTVGFVQIEPDQLTAIGDAVADQEARRHSKIDDVIESTELRGFYAFEGEFDFSAEPRQVDDGSSESMFGVL